MNTATVTKILKSARGKTITQKKKKNNYSEEEEQIEDFAVAIIEKTVE